MALSKDIGVSLIVPGTASTTTYGANIAGFDSYDAVKVVASLVGVTGGTLNMYIQHSWDGGTVWYDCASFAQLADGAAAVTYDFSVVLDSTIRTITKGTVAASVPTLTAGTVTSGPWGNILRLVSKTGGGVSVGATQSVRFLAWEMRK